MESILSHIDEPLGAFEVDDGYELRHQDGVLGWLGNPKFERAVACVVRGSEWTFTRLRGGDTKATSGTAVRQLDRATGEDVRPVARDRRSRASGSGRP